MRTRFAIKITRDEEAWWIYALAQLTNPSWTEREREAKTWASASAARAQARRYSITDFEIVEVQR